MAEFLQQRIAEVAEFIARYKDSTDSELQWAVEAAGGTMAELEGKLASLQSQGSQHGLQRAI
jgi:hypothetical protein